MHPCFKSTLLLDILAGGTFWECMFNFMPQWIPAGADIDAMQALDGSYSVGVSGFKKGKFAAKVAVQLFGTYKNYHRKYTDGQLPLPSR